MTKIAELPVFDPAEFIDNPEDAAAYFSAVIDEGDPSELAKALGVIARAKGMSQIAEQTGLTREALYKALRDGAQPRFDTVRRVCKALGLHLTVDAA